MTSRENRDCTGGMFMGKGENKNKRMFNISRKIMMSIIIANLFVVLVIMSVMYFLLSEKVGEESRSFAISQVESNVNDFQQHFSNIESSVSTLVNMIAERTDVNMAKADKEYLQNLKKDIVPELRAVGEGTDLTTSIYSYYNVDMFNQEVDMWVLDDGNGKFVLQDPFGIDYYNTDIAWYHEPIDSKKTIWTFPYESEAGGIIASYVSPVMKNGEAIGLVGMDLYLDEIAETLKSITLFDSGYLYLMDNDGNLIYHPTLEFGSNLLDAGDFANLLSDMQSEDTGFTSYKDGKGDVVIAAFSHLENGWIVASSVPEKEVLKIINFVIMILIGIGVFMIIVSIIIGKVMGSSISRPILKVVDATEKIKAGDFTVSVDIKTSDETKLLGDGLNEMVSSVRTLITENSKVSKNMLDSASNLAAMSEETTATIEQVAKTIDEISKGSQDTAKDAEKGALVAFDIDNKFNSLIDNSNVMRGNADTVINVNREGLKVLGNLKEKSELSKISSEKVTTAIRNLDSRVSEITNIISTISSIAEQTNLLALNASIEAARAGDAGRGFAVVADEIRKLAENSGKSTGEIKDIVTSIQHESKDTVDVMKEVSVITNEQNIAVDEVTEAFNKIFDAVENITTQIEFVDKELNELGVSKTTLVEVVNNISSVSEETAAATEEVNAAMTEQTNAVEQVAENAERLNELSHELNKQIEMFKI